jgi:PAS domain S-box-containing protein
MIATERQLLVSRTAARTAANASLATMLTVALGLAGLSAILALWALYRASHSLIEATEFRLRSVLDRATDAIFLVSRDGMVRLANDAASRLFGMPIDEFIGQPIASRLAGLHDGSSEVVAVRADGSRFPGDLSIGGDGHRANETVYILRDATERNRLAQLKSEFVSTVSHELRTPLTSIRGSLGLVVAGAAGELPPKARQFLEIAHNNSGRLVHLVNDILDIEKIESGNLEFQRERLPAHDIIEQAIKANQAYADQFGVGFRATATLDDGIDVFADMARIQQVMSNLMSNAAKFSPSGHDVEIAATADRDSVRISVRDHGPGIPASFRHRIFQRFAQADSSDQRQKGGTGLGLSITKAIVEHHGGSIGFDTAAGGGTEFWFTLPRMSAVPAAQDPAPRQGDRRRILVVEDDPDIAKLLSMMLEQNGWATATAHSAAEADILLGQGGFDAMTLDIRLPDENGLDLFRRLRARDETREMPVVVVSAQLDGLRKQLQGDVLDVVDWLDKPIDQGRLRDAVRRGLRRHRPEDPIPCILHVEDDPDIVQFIRGIMADEADIIAAPNLAEARRLLATRHFALVIIDAGLPDGCGLDLIDPIRRLEEAPPALIFSVRDYDASFTSDVAASLVKTRTDNRALHDAIHKLIGDNEATAVRMQAEAG